MDESEARRGLRKRQMEMVSIRYARDNGGIGMNPKVYRMYRRHALTWAKIYRSILADITATASAAQQGRSR